MCELGKINFEQESYFDETDGVYRWTSNDRIPFDDMLKENGVPEMIRELCAYARETETQAFLNEYVENEEKFWTDPDMEEARNERLFEMRAAFGPGEEVVNVFTGRKTQL